MKQPRPDKVNQARTAIGDNDVPTALTLASELAAGHSEWADPLILLQNNWTDLERRTRLRLITEENATVSRNQLIAALLEILTEINQQHAAPEALETPTPESAARELLAILAQNYRAFVSQARIRDSLFFAVESRLKIQAPTQFEAFFAAHFDQMDAGERDLHAAIRDYTQRELFPNNLRSLEILMQHAALEAAIPRLEALKWHLIVWLGKYRSQFLRRPFMALNYVGVEEQMPFPAGIESEITGWLGG